MTVIKLQAKPSAAAAQGITGWAEELYQNPNMRLLGIVELRHVERSEPAPGESKDRTVQLRLTQLEIANDAMEQHLSRGLAALYALRTAKGTFDDDEAIELAESTMRRIRDDLMLAETARLRAGLRLWAEYARRVQHTRSMTQTEALHEVEAIADGLRKLLAGDAPEGTNTEED